MISFFSFILSTHNDNILSCKELVLCSTLDPEDTMCIWGLTSDMQALGGVVPTSVILGLRKNS